MVVRFEFSQADNILRTTISGEMTDQLLMGLFSKGLDVVSSFPSSKSIVDLSGITRFDVSTRSLTRLAQGNPPDLPARVFVAPKDVVYGTTRMFQVLSERTRKNVHVVRTIEEAYKLLQVESPKFVPVSSINFDEQ